MAPVAPDGSRFPGLDPGASDYEVGSAVDRYERELQRARNSPAIDPGNLDVHAVVGDWVPRWLDGMERHLLEAIPPLARPYDEFWVEAQMGGTKYRSLQRYHSWGATVRDLPLADMRRLVDALGVDAADSLVDGEAFGYQMQLYVEAKKDDIVWLGATAFATDKIGEVIRLDERGQWALTTTSYNDEMKINPGLQDANVRVMGELLRPLLATWAFLNLERGVELVTREPSEKLARQFRKKRGGELRSYHELALTDELRRIVDGALSKGESLAQALHTVRGHNVTYTPERPMFGIPGRHGTFHKGSHIRGSAEAGEVVKDYVVHEPTDGPAEPRKRGDVGGVGR